MFLRSVESRSNRVVSYRAHPTSCSLSTKQRQSQKESIDPRHLRHPCSACSRIIQFTSLSASLRACLFISSRVVGWFPLVRRGSLQRIPPLVARYTVETTVERVTSNPRSHNRIATPFSLPSCLATSRPTRGYPLEYFFNYLSLLRLFFFLSFFCTLYLRLIAWKRSSHLSCTWLYTLIVYLTVQIYRVLDCAHLSCS